MLVKRKVAIRAVVTNEFKQRMTGKLEQALEEVAKAEQQLDTQGKRYLSELEGKEPSQAAAFARKLERQKRKQEEIRSRLSGELSRIRELVIGDEHPYGTVEGFVEIGIGDDLDEKLRSAELVIKDGVVTEIRNY